MPVIDRETLRDVARVFIIVACAAVIAAVVFNTIKVDHLNVNDTELVQPAPSDK